MVVATYGPEGRQGSGVTLAPEVVVTNCHVVKDAAKIEVWGASSHHFPAKVLRRQIEQDLCLLYAPGLDTSAAKVNYASEPQPGERVYAVGSPRGLELTISEGLVSGLRGTALGDFIQTTVPISPGSSGGGLFNQSGELVGLTTLGLTSAQNVNFAIPTTRVKTWFGTDFDAMLHPPSIREQEAMMRNAVASVIISSKADIAAPRPAFKTIEERLAHLRWLAAMNDRLKSRSPELVTRLEFLETTFYESKRAGLEPALVLGLIEVTSGFHKYAINKSGARGYMQVAPYWARQIGDGDVARLFHMQTNLRMGSVVLRAYLDEEEGDLFLALVRYGAQSLGQDVDSARAHPSAVFPDKEATLLSARRNWEFQP